MQIYLPIAEMSVNIFLVLALGGGIGLLSGLFGVGGGFLMTPMLIFIGVPPAVTVGTQANQIIAASVSGVLVHLRRGNVDVKMGLILIAGGFVGSTLGVWLFSILKRLGHIDVTITTGYVVFLSVVGGYMLYESLPSVLNRKMPLTISARGPGRHTWIHGLPFKTRFRSSKLYISALLPLVVGFVVGLLSSIMGIGGGFILVPALIYLVGMPTQVVIGTSLLQTIFVAINTTLLQAAVNQTVDVVLALMLLVVGVIGAQVGARLSGKFRAEQLQMMLAIVVLAVAIRLVFEMVVTPQDIFSLGELNR
jgi:uncharacterized membrane protein YfcA